MNHEFEVMSFPGPAGAGEIGRPRSPVRGGGARAGRTAPATFKTPARPAAPGLSRPPVGQAAAWSFKPQARLPPSEPFKRPPGPAPGPRGGLPAEPGAPWPRFRNRPAWPWPTPVPYPQPYPEPWPAAGPEPQAGQAPAQAPGRDGAADVFPAALREAAGRLPAGLRPAYVALGPLPAAPDDRRTDAPGLYLLVFDVDGRLRAYSGQARNVRRRLRQHLLCARMLGFEAGRHRVYLAPTPALDPARRREAERRMRAEVLASDPGLLTNERGDPELELLGEDWR